MTHPEGAARSTPDTFVAFRIVAASLTFFMVVLIGLGFDGYGPLHVLWKVTDSLNTWIWRETGWSLL